MLKLPGNHISNMGPEAGKIKFNFNTQKIEIYDGISWISYPTEVQEITTTEETNRILKWAQRKMLEEQEIENLAKQYPAVQTAYENFKKAKEQLEVTIILSKGN